MHVSQDKQTKAKQIAQSPNEPSSVRIDEYNKIPEAATRTRSEKQE